MGVFWTGLKYVFTDFSCWTSTHGVPHIGMANARWLRAFWILVVVVSIALFIWQFITLLTNYLSFSVNTETTLQFAERTFPTVTICHLNPWKLSETKSVDPDMSALIDAYNSDSSSAQFGLPASLTADRQQQASKWTLMYSERLNEKQYNDAADIAYSYDDMVVSCTYNAKTCNITDFNDFYNPSYGNCLQFNTDGMYSSSRAGPLYGLRMVMRTDQDTYLPWTEASGVIIDIHMQDEIPYPDVFGYFAPPGTASSLGVSYVQTTRLSKPYGSCTTKTKLKTTHYTGTYTVEACFRSCMQEKIIASCGCYYPAYSHASNTTQYVSCDNGVQTLSNLNCVDLINSADSTEFDVLTDCDCPQPCEIDSYGVTVSTAQWPSDSYVPTECNPGGPSGPWDASGESCLDWYKANTILIEIYYERMNFQVLTESPAYTFVNFISDVGGQVGLFLGMSIISAIEYLVLIFLVFFYCCTHKSRRAEIEQLEMDIKKAKDDVDQVAEKRKKHQKANAELYEMDTAHDIVPPKPHSND
ncbi:Amiloride-sensitive sodium channel [Caenorhabditis elegans]|uniref:Amiloride-sensitive sodium channel n=1 Tax=Caenorhabditis elegans TaxID=6239 RepID=P91835_CAEEL|nr:Amiloride-sensitive sodium channel [Caenorhabditis elegans]CAB03443.3 Amiloride-sensitive sodium channel [Caenorhabditis elegans]|eukprot:NP_492230.2 DEgenerin Like [Caenorhabditis elegans]